MAKASDHFRQSDVTTWGIFAVACAGLAMMGSNVSAFVPQSVLGKLHQPRLVGATLDSLRLQVTALNEQSRALRSENEALLARFALQEKSGSEIVRRVGALEVSMPRLLEDLPEVTAVDRGSVTASISEDGTESFEAVGGSVTTRRSPLPLAGAASEAIDQPLPAPLEVAATTDDPPYGLSVGAPVPADGTEALWSDLTLKLGPLLFGYEPLLTSTAEGNKRIVVGPIADLVAARVLCQRFEQVSIACSPTEYAGEALLPR